MLCSPTSRATAEEPFLLVELWRPVEAARAREAEIGAERVAHGVDEPVDAPRCKTVLPPGAEHLDAAFVPVDARLDPPDKALAEDDGQHVPAPPPFGRWVEELPHVVEI